MFQVKLLTEDLGLRKNHLKLWLVGFGGDGASVNFGSSSGIVMKLQQGISPAMHGNHCYGHRVNLVVKAAEKVVFEIFCPRNWRICRSEHLERYFGLFGQGIYFAELGEVLTGVFVFFSRWAKRAAELQALADLFQYAWLEASEGVGEVRS